MFCSTRQFLSRLMSQRIQFIMYLSYLELSSESLVKPSVSSEVFEFMI